jgi:predicted metalloprotease with PDZ domain
MLAAAAALLCAAKAPEERTISYRITPLAAGGYGNALRVEMRLRGDSDGETAIELPNEWAGSIQLWHHVTDLKLRGATRVSGYFQRPVLHHRPGARLSIRYDIVSAYSEDPGFAYEKARPMVRPTWFFFHGEGVFPHPAGREASPARFRWGKMPRGWTVASDLDHIAGQRTTVANMIDSVAIGGRGLAVERRDVDGAPLRVASIGKWNFGLGELADTVESIVKAENDFWGERSTPFLVAMAPLGEVPAGLSYMGTGRADAFSIASTSAFELKQATRFLGHEYMHSWVPIALGAMPGDEATDYWFSEGFNDYLASKVLLRSGLWKLTDYIADKNVTLLRYGTSPAKTATAAQVAEGFWTDSDVRQVSYDRGHLLATLLDSEIAARSSGSESLDTIMRAQREAAKGSTELASTLLRAVVLDRTGIDAAPLIERHARDGRTLELAGDTFGECARIVVDRRRDFHRGYDADATRLADGIVTGVVPGGPAHAAGMRDGMRLVRREGGTIGDSTIPISYRVADDSGERVLTYLPEGKTEFEVQRLQLTAEGEAQEAACTRRLGGGK